MRDTRHRSADQDSWTPKCAGCLPVEVRPHRCTGQVLAMGTFPCLCNEAECTAGRGDTRQRDASTARMLGLPTGDPAVQRLLKIQKRK